MRLINYEEYKNKLLEIRDSIPLTVPAATYELMREKPYAQGMAMRGGIHKALKCLEQCQNVSDVAPVVHGRWEGYTRSRYIGCDEYGNPRYVDGVVYYCSNPRCRRRTVIKERYCPSCGAKMDGGADND